MSSGRLLLLQTRTHDVTSTHFGVWAIIERWLLPLVVSVRMCEQAWTEACSRCCKTHEWPGYSASGTHTFHNHTSQNVYSDWRGPFWTFM